MNLPREFRLARLNCVNTLYAFYIFPLPPCPHRKKKEKKTVKPGSMNFRVCIYNCVCGNVTKFNHRVCERFVEWYGGNSHTMFIGKRFAAGTVLSCHFYFRATKVWRFICGIFRHRLQMKIKLFSGENMFTKRRKCRHSHCYCCCYENMTNATR